MSIIEIISSRHMNPLSLAIVLHITSFCLCAYYTQSDWEITNYRAVTRFLELTNYYKDLRRKFPNPTANQPQESRDPIKAANAKKLICKNIFRNVFFERRSQQWIDVDVDVERADLKERHRQIFDDIFRTSSNPSCGGIWTRQYEYANPYNLLPTTYAEDDGSRAFEYVIICPVRDPHSKEVVEYYVSQPYNVNLVHNAYPIFGRFIFSVTSGDQMALEAMAEESAISSEFFRRTKLLESFYLAKRKNFQTPAIANMDPMCALSNADKVRLCASCFGASVFMKNGYKFFPDPYNANELECHKRRVNLSTLIFAPVVRVVGRMVFNPHKLYEEWVIGCEATRVQRNSPVTFYIARGNEHNTAFIFKEVDNTGKLSVYGFLNNISVIRDTRTDVGTAMPVNLLAYK